MQEPINWYEIPFNANTLTNFSMSRTLVPTCNSSKPIHFHKIYPQEYCKMFKRICQIFAVYYGLMVRKIFIKSLIVVILRIKNVFYLALGSIKQNFEIWWLNACFFYSSLASHINEIDQIKMILRKLMVLNLK